jgi:membrane protein DedA with SNARE-associated domain
LIPIAFLGLLTGDSINFFIARKFGPVLLKKRPFKWILSEAKVKQAEDFLSKRGSQFVFCVRFLPFIRTALFFTAGSLQISPRVFYFLNGASTLIYLFAILNLSYSAGEHIDVLISTFKRFQFVLLGLFVVSAVYLLIKGKPKRPLLS